MIRISIVYPRDPGGRFDMHYYLTVHAPFALSRLGDAVSEFAIEEGVDIAPFPNSRFIAAGHYLCESAEAFMSLYATHAEELQADVPNYTDIKPIIQVSTVHRPAAPAA